jgi:hypothetical protein
MRNVSDKRCRENHNTHFVFDFVFENRVVYDAIWKNILEPAMPWVKIWRMRIACWIPKAVETHTDTMYFFIDFLLPQ